MQLTTSALLTALVFASSALASAPAPTTPTTTTKLWNSGIYDEAGNVLSALVPDNLPFIPTGTVNLALPAPVPHVGATKRDTNADRMRRGLHPMAPVIKRGSRRDAPQPSNAPCSPVPTQGHIAVHDATTLAPLGYISSTYDFQNSYTYTALESEAQVFSIPATNQYNTLIDITAVSGPDESFPLLGAVGGAGGFELGSGRSDYVYLSGSGPTDAGSTPSSTAGNSIEVLGYSAPSESKIWALACSLEIAVQWVDDIGFTTPSSQSLFYDPSVDYLGVTADVGAFNAAFPGEGAIPVTFTYVPL